MTYLFTSESVSEGHPDKISDQISDSILDHFLAFDPNSKIAIETLVTTGQIIISGEVKSNAWININDISRNIVRKIGYSKNEYKFNADSCGIFTSIKEQSQDLLKGIIKDSIEQTGAGDQGIVFGYAVKETDNYMPIELEIANNLLKELATIRKEGVEMTYLRPDSKSQITLEHSSNYPYKPIHVHSVVISTQHNEFDTKEKMNNCLIKDIINILMPRFKKKYCSKNLRKLFTNKTRYYINSIGKFVIGGPNGDTGLTGRKIIVDTYGSRARHGGGAFSGKDPSKMDRSGAYEARHIAKNIVASGIANELLIQISYVAGISEPISIFVDTCGTSKVSNEFITKNIKENFDLRPYAIEKRLKLREPIYEETSAYGHMGKNPKKINKFFIDMKKRTIKKEVELFTWEKLDYLNIIKDIFNI